MTQANMLRASGRGSGVRHCRPPAFYFKQHRLFPTIGIGRGPSVTHLSCHARQVDQPVGVHALVWAGGWTEKECRTAIEGSKRAGYDLIEIPVFRPEELDASMTKAVLEQNGMNSSCSLGLTLDTDISSESEECVQRGKQVLLNALSFTSAVGGSHLCGVIHSAIAKYLGPSTQQGRLNSARVLKELAVRARDRGVTLGLEVINRYETNLLNTVVQGREMLELIDEPNVTIHLDTYHMHIEENGMEGAVRMCGDKLGYVHIGESHRGYLGTGNVDFDNFFKALAAINYRGPITFESFSSEVVSLDLSNNLCVWRNLWSDSEDLATHANCFIRAHTKAARMSMERH